MARLSLLLLIAVLGTVRAVDLAEFLSNPTYKPFLDKALQTTACLTDPAVTGGQFDLDLCPSVLEALSQLNAGATEVEASCEPACAQTFAGLGPDCLSQLTDAFEADTSTVGVVGSGFLAECAAGGTADGSAPAPAPGAAAGRRMGRL
jgi:hypothetical protein